MTHPDLAGRGVGVLIAFWALDHAARHGKRWVRRGVLTLGPANRGLVRYYRWQGWRVVRVIARPRKDSVSRSSTSGDSSGTRLKERKE